MNDLTRSEDPGRSGGSRSVVSRLLGFFSSVWLGIALLCVLFVYASIGSSGLPVRLNIFRPDAWMPLREAFELSEYEWFHWWPFEVLIALLCLNIVLATLRRIPLNLVNLGAWLTHAGIIVLALGSVWYFSTKVEGDAPVARREIVARLPGGEEASMIATPGGTMRIGDGEETYILQVREIVPEWELLSGDDKGKRTYKVAVFVQGPDQTFIRELLAGYPQYTEDLVRSDDPQQPFVRAKKTRGKALVDETIELSLDYAPQEYFYLAGSSALYLREVGAEEWIERPIDDLPRFNDYLASYDHVWLGSSMVPPPLRPIEVAVPPADVGDPMPDVAFSITEHLRYAQMRQRIAGGGDRINPAATVRIAVDTGAMQDYELLALDPQRRTALGGALEFHWLESEPALAALRDAAPPMLHIEIPAQDIVLEEPIEIAPGEDAPFTPIAGTEYRYRVRATPTLADRGVSLAIVDIERGEQNFTRWVFDDPAMTRDLSGDGGMAEHSGAGLIDENIIMTYEPGEAEALHLIAGPEDDALRLLVPARLSEVTERDVVVGEPMTVTEGATLTVLRYLPRGRLEARPFLVPPAQRDRSVGSRASMIRLNLPVADTGSDSGFDSGGGSPVESVWLPYHDYPFQREEETLRRYPYRPTTVALPDGRRIEFMFSRRRLKLPSPVALETFEVESHVGGFTGETASIRDWRSMLKFRAETGWTDPIAVHMNNPVEFQDLWFFQSSWDPPEAPRFQGDPGSSGLNYTILGVANRNGVLVQLLGCCIAVAGMIYAFYCKPYIRRRRQAPHAAIAREGGS
ncbi:MAG: hypothetical protein SYC29_11175 [Planctomycetota bacterium]|nr:hypothetical protein [Planctomycetota bacterium]